MYNSVTDSVHFTINLTQERVFIDRFYRINHAKTYNFDAPTLVTSASHKITAKMPYSLSKINIFDEETTFRHTFLSSDLQCLPPGDPRILCAKHTYPITGKSSIARKHGLHCFIITSVSHLFRRTLALSRQQWHLHLRIHP